MHGNTMFLGQLIGIVILMIAFSVILQREATVAAFDAIVKNRSMLFLIGILQIIAGVSIILTHNVWSGGPLTIVVTVIGWILAIKGAICLYFSPEALTKAYKVSGFSKNALVYAVIMLALGAYLIYAGFGVMG